MKILFLHPNFPGQYKHLARYMASDPENQVVFLSKSKKAEIPGVKRVDYKISREVEPQVHRYIIGLQRGILAGQEVWRACKEMKKQGFVPDVIAAHSGWGDGIYLKDIYPDSRLLNYMEFYYSGTGADVNFDPEEQLEIDDYPRIRTKNCVNMINLEACDWGISPTLWQRSMHPKEYRYKISALHEGIDTETLFPARVESLTLPDGRVLSPDDEIVTYVSRNFEPYRGFPTFMRAIGHITRRRPDCHVLIAGSDGVSYGKKLPAGKTYRQALTEEVNFDKSRVHFLGALPYEQYVKLLQISSAHIYLTVPFVLSWSMMEAMAAGCLMICSDTAPVKEVLKDRENGLLASFFSPEEIADRVDEVFAHPDRMQELRQNARKTILQKYALSRTLPLHKKLLVDLAEGKVPPPADYEIRSVVGYES